MDLTDFDAQYMARALELAQQGQGFVEPNPMVGCVIVAGDEVVGEGFHARFGGPHAEVEALAMAGARATGSTMYVTLEPCCHHGKTPPCTAAVIRAGIRRVVIAQQDPFAAVDGRGLAELRAAGVEVELGLRQDEAQVLNAPYLKLLRCGRPWLIAKWAMTLDGKIATHGGNSRWISGELSRQVVHTLRGRVDAVMIGRRTAERDDPLLTARPSGPRVATRIVLDTLGRISSESKLVRTAREVGLLVAVGPQATQSNRQRLRGAGCEVVVCEGSTQQERLGWLMAELGRRRMTNVLVEGGEHVLGSLADGGAIDEVHVFIAPKLIGGAAASSPIGGAGRSLISQAWSLQQPVVTRLGDDIYVRGFVTGK